MLHEFSLDSIAFEARYDSAFLLWDHAGELWSNAREIWPELEPVEIQPNTTVFRNGREFELSARLDRLNITDFRPSRGAARVGTLASSFLSLAARHLELTSFSRLGLRAIYSRQQKDKAEATDWIFQTGRVNAVPELVFGILGKPQEAELVLRWEDDEIGARFQLLSQEVTIEMRPPPDIKDFEPETRKKAGLKLDIDYYTTAAVHLNQLDAGAWVDSAFAQIESSADHLLIGA
jgi:hypothetical protein